MGLLLVSSAVFSACGNDYKKLEITSNVKEIRLVLDDSKLSYNNDLIFEVSGVKKWGELKIDSEPSGLVKVTHAVRGTNCYVRVDALQPSSAGSQLVVTHLGSGKNIKIPLIIGRKLQTLESSEQLMVVSLPKPEAGATKAEKIIELPTKQLLIAQPSNYTDNIVWGVADPMYEDLEGVEVISYDIDGNKLNKIFTHDLGASGDKLTGVSSAVKTIVKINQDCLNNSSIELNPINVLDKRAVRHNDIKVVIQFMDVLTAKDVIVTSSTHGRAKLPDPDGGTGFINDDNKLTDLVLISNPDEDKPREGSANGYDYYSAAIIDLKTYDAEGKLDVLHNVNKSYSSLYDIELSTNLFGLLLENVKGTDLEFGKIRVVASNTCYGDGEIYVKFKPRECIGDIEEFVITIPCSVGGRATGIAVSRSGRSIAVDKIDEYNFKSVDVPLNDSTSFGQLFRFEILSTNTLESLKTYRISIDKSLLYINPARIQADGTCPTIADMTGKLMAVNAIGVDPRPGTESEPNLQLADICQYQISILKDGKEVYFNYDGKQNFVSEALTSRNGIYIKWVKSNGTKSINSVTFGLNIVNVLDEKFGYDIANHGFDKTTINYELVFNRQRTVASINYKSVKVERVPGAEHNFIYGNGNTDPAGDNGWQFYFRNDMLNGYVQDGKIYFYGIQITDILGLGEDDKAKQLTLEELKAINIDVKINPTDNIQNPELINLGLAQFDKNTFQTGSPAYDNSCVFNYDGNDEKNVLIIGRIDDATDTSCGDYTLSFSQNGVELNYAREIKIYKSLDESDIVINMPNADFAGKDYWNQYTKLESEPADWSIMYNTYYVFDGNEYTLVPSGTEAPSFKARDYYKFEDELKDIDLDSTYILATEKSGDNAYQVNIDIQNKDFLAIENVGLVAQLLECGSVDGETAAYITPEINVVIEDGRSNYIATISTKTNGLYNSGSNNRRYIKVTYSFVPFLYEYNKVSKDPATPIEKSIYVYIYTPLKSSHFYEGSDNKKIITSIQKYNYNSVLNSEFKAEFAEQELKISLNNLKEGDIFNYATVEWVTPSTEGLLFAPTFEGYKAKFTFKTIQNASEISFPILAIIRQFGIQQSIKCDVVVRKPVLTERLMLDNDINYFESGTAFINLNRGATLQLNPIAYPANENDDITMPGFDYILCSTSGYKLAGGGTQTNVNSDGLITASKAGRFKLIVVAKDRIKLDIDKVVNYLNFDQYIDRTDIEEGHLPYTVTDILVSDGSEDNPHLISTAHDFERINESLAMIKNQEYLFFALTNNIDLGGKGITINEFNGVIFSYNETAHETNRFTVYGGLLTNINPTLFSTLAMRDDGKANLIDIDFILDINYVATIGGDKYIGLVGTNAGKIKDCSVKISGTVNANNMSGTYNIGGMVALNNSIIEIKDSKLVGVSANITVTNGGFATINLGGVIGQNIGTLTGVVTNTLGVKEDDIKYEVTYDNQGAMADVDLRVHDAADGAIGGVVGYNNKGVVSSVYSMGKVSGRGQNQSLSVSNVGGLIGKNIASPYNEATISVGNTGGNSSIKSVTLGNTDFQITNSYSSAEVVGKDNVGGAVGYDEYGTYQKVYYEIYDVSNAVMGNDKVGGLIGCANNSTLQYCYANSFAWEEGYTKNNNSVTSYDITGNRAVGGLVGLAYSSDTYWTNSNNISNVNIISCLASVTIEGKSKAFVGGLVGKMENYGAVYHAYYYGIIKDFDTSNSTYSALTNLVNQGAGEVYIKSNNLPYNSAYAIVLNHSASNILALGTLPQRNGTDGNLSGFNSAGADSDVVGNYIIDSEGNNIVTQIPTAVEIEDSFNTINYNKDNQLFKKNSNGEYVRINDDTYEPYSPTNNNHKDKDRYTLIAHLEQTNDISGTASDYRAKALILYYYQFSDLTGDNAVNDMYTLNTVDMHDILADDGIIVIPDTWKKFNVYSSNNEIVRVLDGGKLLLCDEGQVTITIVSQLNPSAKASFVAIVRTKVHHFGLHSSSDIHANNNLKDKTISVVNGYSKIIYADYSGVISYYGRTYSYNQATNMAVKLTVTLKNGGTLSSGKIGDYITINDSNNAIANNNSEYSIIINNNTPITINVVGYSEYEFKITAIPCVIANYQNGATQSKIIKELESSYYQTQFYLTTKKGATAINVDHTLIEMMPAGEAVNLGVKVNTDIAAEKVTLRAIVSGDYQEEINGVVNNALEMFDITYRGTKNNFTDNDNDGKAEFDLTIVEPVDANDIQAFNLVIALNDKTHYSTLAFTIQLELIVKGANGNKTTIMHIKILPQEIVNVMALNYRIEDSQQKPDLNDARETKVIRPGATNIITIDINPSIAIYDYVEIKDVTAEDKILFQQVTPDLTPMEHMDTWVEAGIKLKKYIYNTSKLYLLAKLPINSTANIEHTLMIEIYDKNGKLIESEPLVLQAIMYPTIVMTYSYPNGVVKTVNTREGSNQRDNENVDAIYLAAGVEAAISIETNSIDEQSLANSIEIKDSDGNKFNNEQHVTLGYGNNQYVLRFDANKRKDLVGKTVSVKFTAFKKLNGVTEHCSATMTFTIVEMVVHGASMTHSLSTGDIYGHWDETFKTQFYFGKHDISYYRNGYWNVDYSLDNIPEHPADPGLQKIRELLVGLNNIGTGVVVKLGNNPISEDAEINDTINGIKISHKEYAFNITVTNPSDTHIIHTTRFSVSYKVAYQNYYPVLTTNNIAMTLSDNFGFNISDKTQLFGPYKYVKSQEDFINMIEGDRYAIELEDGQDTLVFDDLYTPIDTQIAELNGNGYTIKITNFNTAQLLQNYTTGNMKIGLFGTIGANTVIRNLKVLYETERGRRIELNFDESITTTEQVVNDIIFGGIASENNGVITNVQTSGSISISSVKVKADKIKLGGIAAINNVTYATPAATITNSTSDITMDALAMVAGVAVQNNGKIVNTNFTGAIKVKATEAGKDYVSFINTAGFVLENSNQGYISLSYVKAGLNLSEGIDSVNTVAGFVYNNAGTIDNCYITNTRINSQGGISGFVYQTSGSVTHSYANASFGSSIFYQPFISSSTGADEVENCYYISDSDKVNNVAGLVQIGTSEIRVQEKYKNFIFGVNAVWTMQNGPELNGAGYTDNFSEIYNVYDLETFKYFTHRGDGLSTVTDIESDHKFRIVRDLNFENVESNPFTHNTTLKTWIEGNDMEISNYRINNTSENLSTVGLFGTIGSFSNDISSVYIRNMILKPAEIKASNSGMVGSLAGTIINAGVYNVTVDSQNLLILGKNAVGGLAGIIKGSFDVNGVRSNVSAFATYTNTESTQYALYLSNAVYSGENESLISYAGSVAGVVDGYESSVIYDNIRLSSREINSSDYYALRNISVIDGVVLLGETVGGAFGLVCEYTRIDGIEYNMTDKSRYQGKYVAGGLVGENRGVITNSNIYANKLENNAIVDIDTTAAFNGYARVNGGVVGLNLGGLVHTCSSDIKLYTNTNQSTVGGIVGRNIEGSVYNCVVSSNIGGQYIVGGVIGTDYNYDTIIDVNRQYGSATEQTKIVYYNTIRNKVKYTNITELSAFAGNKLSHKFIISYATNQKQYYSINSRWVVNNNEEKMLDCNAVFGLAIGMTYEGNDKYIYNITYNNRQLEMSYGDTHANDKYNAIYGAATYPVSPIIAPIQAQDISYNNGTDTLLAYIIGYHGAYDYWTSSLGYGDQYIVLCPQTLTEWVDVPVGS